jgi:hypothetical protein
MLFDEPIGENLISSAAGESWRLWLFLPVGYLMTILIETPIVVFGLSPKISLKQRILCGIWLTACTYPIVILVLPNLLGSISWLLYVVVAEIFAPAGECFVFWIAFRSRADLNTKDWIRCFVAIIVANLTSFGIGEILNAFNWFGLFN